MTYRAVFYNTITGSCISHHNNLAEVYGKSIRYGIGNEIDTPYECNDKFTSKDYKITLKDLLKNKEMNESCTRAAGGQYR